MELSGSSLLDSIVIWRRMKGVHLKEQNFKIFTTENGLFTINLCHFLLRGEIYYSLLQQIFFATIYGGKLHHSSTRDGPSIPHTFRFLCVLSRISRDSEEVRFPVEARAAARTAA